MSFASRALCASLVAVSAIVSSTAFAQRNDDNFYYWREGTQTLTREGRKTSANERLEATVSSTQYHYYTSYDRVRVRVPVYECTELSNTNTWQGYFTPEGRVVPGLSRTKKIEALSKAINGVAEKYARQIITLNTLQHRPRTWAAFVQWVTEADQAIDGLYYNVLERQGAAEANRRNLGYAYAAGTQDNCRLVSYRDAWTNQEVTHDEAVPGSTRTEIAVLDVRGGELLAQESERFVVKYRGGEGPRSERGGLWVEAQSSYNDYRIAGSAEEGRNRTYKVATGTRKRVEPNASNLTVYAKWEGNQVVVEVTDKNFTDSPALGRRYIAWEVWQNYFPDQQKGKGSFEMKPGNWTKWQTGVGPSQIGQARRKRVRVKYFLSYSGSAYFLDKMSGDQSTGWIDVP
ncbi:MAG TPA: hypothetical protein VM598_01760 [Bdellovibrionota bacterium]|nr:hypothetical protein [Bdellovibrionota bacterium]